MTSFINIAVDLQLFADGTSAAAAGDGNGAAANAEVAAPQKSSGAKNSLANIVYGKQAQAPAAEVTAAEPTAATQEKSTPDRKAVFETLIKGEYKDLYDERVSDTVQKRLRGSKEIVDKYTALTPLLDTLAHKYGVDASDSKALMAAIEADDSFYEAEALERGLTVEEYKRVRKVESENAELKRQLSARRTQEEADRIIGDWIRGEADTKKVYPSFDLRTELGNPNFERLLRAGIDVRTAFEVVHKDQIIPAAMQYTAQEVAARTANSIRSNMERPTENGVGTSVAALVKDDVSKLTREDRREIARRVAAGAKISF